MINTYTIFEGTKATIDGKRFSFDCEPDDIDTAYDALAENVRLSNQDQDRNQDLMDFENAADDDVQTLLDDMKRMGFIGDWEASNPSKGSYKMINKNFYELTDFNAGHVLGLLKTTARDYAGECDTLEELSYHAYNEDYNYIYYKDAARALQNAGVFDCFQVVHTYLMDMAGEDNTNYADPVNVANSLLYIQGEQITQAVAEWIGVDLDDELDPEEWNKLLCTTINNLEPFLDDFHSFKEH